PFPHFRTRLFLGAGTIGEKFQSVIEYLELSSVWLRTHGDAPTFAMRYHILLVLALMIGWGSVTLWQWWSGRRNADEAKPILWEVALHLFNLLGFYAII